MFSTFTWGVELDLTKGSDKLTGKLTVQDDGVCLDEIQEYQALVKTTSANQSDKDSAHAKKESAIGKRIGGHEEDCETLMQEAIGLID
jgi:hypothetical protein